MRIDAHERTVFRPSPRKLSNLAGMNYYGTRDDRCRVKSIMMSGDEEWLNAGAGLIAHVPLVSIPCQSHLPLWRRSRPDWAAARRVEAYSPRLQ